MKDYYEILQVPRSASSSDIKQAYRKLALTWHPDRVEISDQETAAKTFELLSEAYECLSTSELRAVYDKYGEQGLKQGIPTEEGLQSTNFCPSNPLEVFEKFFGSIHVFDQFFTHDQSEFFADRDIFNNFSGMKSAEKAVDTEDIVHELSLSLAELYLGTRRKICISDIPRTNRFGSVTMMTRDYNIEIKAGWKDGTKLRFEGDGPQHPGMAEPGDVVFVIKQEKHPEFRREGCHLVYDAEISLLEALTGTSVVIRSLDGRTLRIPVNDIVDSTSTVVYQGEGMPQNDGSRGDLIVKFKVKFPNSLTDQQKALLHKALS
ncbi:hypothetical protein PCE1_001659 [Barthelona sp. PCE]